MVAKMNWAQLDKLFYLYMFITTPENVSIYDDGDGYTNPNNIYVNVTLKTGFHAHIYLDKIEKFNDWKDDVDARIGALMFARISKGRVGRVVRYGGKKP